MYVQCRDMYSSVCGTCLHVVCIIYIGAAPTDVVAEQDGPDTVAVSWTAPPAPPTNYRLMISGARTAATTVSGTTRSIGTESQFGVYSIRVMSNSQHLPGQTSDPVQVTVRGKHILLGVWCQYVVCELLFRYPGTSYLPTITFCHISHHHLDSA